MKRSLGIALVLVFTLILAPLAMHAQDAASVTGVVTDTSGAVIVGADVALTNTTTNVSFKTKTNSVGSYTFVSIPPGPGYKMTFTQGGFEPIEVSGVYLTVGSTRTQNVKLAAGNVATTLEVSAASQEVTLDTTDATIGNNFDVKLLNDLPVQSRTSPSALFTLQPGYANGSFAGARTDQTNVTVDGMDVNDLATGQTFVIVANAPTDSVQEFRGTVAGLLPGQGTGSGGQFQLVTKSGTNSFHGDLNEYHRDTSTVANTWFNNNSGLPRTPLIRNQFGGAIGGPIKKDKLFFFFDFNNDRIVQSVSVLRTVPTASFLSGNLSYINNGTGCASSSRSNTTPNCITTLTSPQVATLDPQHKGFNPYVMTFLNSAYGTQRLAGGVIDPTAGDGVNTIGFRFNSSQPQTTYGYVGRVDYNLNEKQRLFARFTIAREDATEFTNEFPSDPFTAPFQDRSYGYVVSHVWQISQNKVNQFYYGDTISKYNFPNLYNPSGTTQMNFTKYISGFLSGPYVSGESQNRRIPIPTVRDDFGWQIGNHNLSFGGTFKFVKTNSRQVNDFNFVTVGPNAYTPLSPRPANVLFTTTGFYDFQGAFNVALGNIAEADSNYIYDRNEKVSPQGNGAPRHYRFFQTELYAGDTWKVNSHLTLDYGVRYQLYSVPYETTGFESIQNLTYQQYLDARISQSNSGTTGSAVVPLNIYSLGGKANNAAPLFHPSYKDFAPRFAFAYNPSYSPKTVINGSAALVYDRTVIEAVDFIQDQSSQLFQQSLTSPQFNGYTDPRLGAPSTGSVIPSFTNPNTPTVITRPYTPNIDNGDVTGIPGAPDGLINNQFNTIVDPNLKTPYSLNFNVGIQQEMPGHFVLKVNYVSRQGRRLLAQADTSQLIDFKDKVSGQTMGAAMTNLEGQVRAHNGAAFNATPIPWFENVLGNGTYYTPADYSEPNATQLVVDNFESLLLKGDFADTMQGLAGDLVLPSNAGMASQWAGNTYLTNGGFSSYNGLLVTLSKNMSHGLQFDLNYTWSHSIDNTSQVANSIASGSGYGFLCDVMRPRECRSNSDFDVQNVINSAFVYDLPFGHQRMFASNTPGWLNRIVGGWQISGTPQWRSGFALTTATTSFVAGYANNAPAIFNGKRADVAVKPFKSSSNTVFAFKSCSSTSCGTALADFSYPTGFTIGSRNVLRGPSAFSMDAGLGKNFAILPSDRLNLRFRADFFNVLNHPVFSNPSADISSASTFGQITSTASSPRVGQFSLRLEF
jgi:hypothetical protein